MATHSSLFFLSFFFLTAAFELPISMTGADLYSYGTFQFQTAKCKIGVVRTARVKAPNTYAEESESRHWTKSSVSSASACSLLSIPTKNPNSY